MNSEGFIGSILAFIFSAFLFIIGLALLTAGGGCAAAFFVAIFKNGSIEFALTGGICAFAMIGVGVWLCRLSGTHIFSLFSGGNDGKE